MKKIYEIPELKAVYFYNEDIVTGSQQPLINEVGSLIETEQSTLIRIKDRAPNGVIKMIVF